MPVSQPGRQASQPVTLASWPAGQPACHTASQSAPASQTSEPGSKVLVSKPARQHTSQPGQARQPASKPAQQASWHASQPANQARQPDSRPASQPASRLVVSQAKNELARQQASQAGSKRASQPGSRTAGQPGGRTASQPASSPASQSASRSAAVACINLQHSRFHHTISKKKMHMEGSPVEHFVSHYVSLLFPLFLFPQTVLALEGFLFVS